MVMVPLNVPEDSPAGFTETDIDEGAVPDAGETNSQPTLDEAFHRSEPPPAFVI
jgi:hypothetical protein